jgi:hypothetical protein
MCQLSSRAAIDSVLFGRIVARDSSLPAFYKATSSQPSLLPHYNLRVGAEVLVHQTNTGGNSISSWRKRSEVLVHQTNAGGNSISSYRNRSREGSAKVREFLLRLLQKLATAGLRS